MNKNKKMVFSISPAIIIIVSPFWLSMISNEGTYTEKQLSIMSMTSQWLGFIALLSLVAVFACFSRRGKNFWNTGCAVLSLILAFIFFDSVKFNTGEVGVADSSFLQSIVPMLSGSAGREVRLSGALPEGRPLHFSSASLRLWAGALPARCH